MNNDIRPVTDLVHRYADAVVHVDESAWAATWADDGVWRLTDADIVGRTAIVDAWRSAMSGFAAVVQNVTNGTADLDGSRGSGRWYVIEHAQTVDGHPLLMLGHYDDDYTLTADGWRFARRSLTIHYAGAPDLSGAFATIRRN